MTEEELQNISEDESTPNADETVDAGDVVDTSSVEASEEETQSEEESAGAEVSEEEVKKPVVPQSETKWYSLRVISGKERKIKERIDLEISRSGWGDVVRQIFLPTEKVYKIRNGKKVIMERNILPGYILVEAVPKSFTGEMIQSIAGTPNVIHFLGKNNPIPMRDSEANKLLGKVDDSADSSEAMVEPFIVGESIKIVDGPFNEFVGEIQEINDEKKKLKVIVKIFGRGTEVELNFLQVEKQS